MTIKRINAISCARIVGLFYAAIGFIVGGLIAIAGLLGLFAASGLRIDNGFTAGLCIGAILFSPFLYGAFGFVTTWVGASVYNVLAGVVGGVQIEVVPIRGSGWSDHNS